MAIGAGHCLRPPSETIRVESLLVGGPRGPAPSPRSRSRAAAAGPWGEAGRSGPAPAAELGGRGRGWSTERCSTWRSASSPGTNSRSGRRPGGRRGEGWRGAPRSDIRDSLRAAVNGHYGKKSWRFWGSIERVPVVPPIPIPSCGQLVINRFRSAAHEVSHAEPGRASWAGSGRRLTAPDRCRPPSPALGQVLLAFWPPGRPFPPGDQ